MIVYAIYRSEVNSSLWYVTEGGYRPDGCSPALESIQVPFRADVKQWAFDAIERLGGVPVWAWTLEKQPGGWVLECETRKRVSP